MSDYRYRGYSLSDDQPALQAGFTATHESGFYGDIFLSTIDEYGIGDDGDGAKIEITASAGWAGTISGFDMDASVASYSYPDGDAVSYIEVPVQISRTINAFTWSVGAAYAAEQTALGDEDNRYAWAGVNYAAERLPISLNARVGYEDGAFAPEGKTDWTIGAEYHLGSATLGLSWVASSGTDDTLVASIFAAF